MSEGVVQRNIPTWRILSSRTSTLQIQRLLYTLLDSPLNKTDDVRLDVINRRFRLTGVTEYMEKYLNILGVCL